MLIPIVAALTAAIAIWYYLVKPLRYWSDLGVGQTKPWLILGDTWITIFSRMGIYEFVQYVYNLYPNDRYVGMYNFNSPVLLIKDPELIKQLGVKYFDSFTDHVPIIDPDADPLWSKTLFSLRGDRWKEMRILMSPTFTSSKIKNLFVLMVETAENFVNYFHEKADDVIELDMKDIYTRFTNDIIATTAFGVKVDSLQDKQNTFYEMGKRITDFKGVLKVLKFLGSQVLPKLFKFLGVRLLDATASTYFYSVIEDTIKVREEKHIVRPDIINILLEARKGKSEGSSKPSIEISNADITSQAVIFFFAGFETVSTAMCFGSYELAVNKHVQDRLRKEIRDTAKNGKIDYETLQNIVYLDQVVSEILRKWPPSPSIDRLCTKPYTIKPSDKNEKPIHLKEGHKVMLPIFALHRDPKYFPNPDKFDPERFSDENKNNILPCTYLPFGVGPRICIGNRFALIEIKALFFHMLLHYEIVPTKKTPIPLVLEKEFQPAVKGGFWMGLKRIKS